MVRLCAPEVKTGVEPMAADVNDAVWRWLSKFVQVMSAAFATVMLAGLYAVN